MDMIVLFVGSLVFRRLNALIERLLVLGVLELVQCRE